MSVVKGFMRVAPVKVGVLAVGSVPTVEVVRYQDTDGSEVFHVLPTLEWQCSGENKRSLLGSCCQENSFSW